MSGTPFAWSDEQVKQPPPSGGASSGAFAWSDEDKDAKAAEDTTQHIGVNRGPQTSSPGYRYSEGFAGEGDAPRKYSGGFIDRATSQFGQDLQNPRNFIPSWKDLIFPGWTQTEQDYQRFKHPEAAAPDPAETAGHMGIPVLGALVTHAADAAPNLSDVARSEKVPSGIAHPYEGVKSAIGSFSRPDLLQAVKDPLGSAWRAIKSFPDAVRSGLGDDIRIQPAPRSAPAWKTAPQEDLAVPSILNRQPYAQAPRVRPAPPSEVAAPGQAGSMVKSVESTPPAAPPATPRNVQSALEQSLGVQGVVPNVPLREQPAAQARIANTPTFAPITDLSSTLRASGEAAKAAGPKFAPISNLAETLRNSDIPEGFTPVESKAIRGYHYDPEARQFEAVTKDGSRVVTGEVSPEQFADFEKASSKGAAWKTIRDNGTPIGKVQNGIRIHYKPPISLRSATPESVAPDAEDLSAEWKRNNEYLRKRKQK